MTMDISINNEGNGKFEITEGNVEAPYEIMKRLLLLCVQWRQISATYSDIAILYHFHVMTFAEDCIAKQYIEL